MRLNPYLKFGIYFGATSTLCLALSPILIPFIIGFIIPLLVIFIGCLLTNAQRTITFLLQCYHQFNVLKIKYIYGQTPESNAHNKLITGEAWSRFCDTLKSASTAISNGPSDELEQAEGYRFLARTVYGLYKYLYSIIIYIYIYIYLSRLVLL